MRLLPGTKKFGFRTIVLTQAQQRSRLFVCLFRMPSFSAPAPPNRFRYPGTRLLRPEQDGRERLRPSGRSAAASGGPAGRPTSAARGTAIPAHGSCLPPAPPNRFRYPGTRLLRPIRFFGSLPALRPRSTASAFFRPANRASRLHRRPLRPRRPSVPSGTGRTRKAPTLREKCRGIRRSGRSAHPCGPRHGYSAPPVADGAFSVHRCSSISTNHSGQRHGRRVSLRMNPSTVDPVLSSSPRSFRIS